MSCRALHWTGAGKIPARHFGYWQATIPLVRVQLIGEQLTVRIQPRWLGRLVGARALATVPTDGTEVGLIRGNATWQGIEFRPRHQPAFYFFTRRREAMLTALSAAGFTISSADTGYARDGHRLTSHSRRPTRSSDGSSRPDRARS